MSDWQIRRTPLGVHVIPKDDLVEHEESPECPCGPTVEWSDPKEAIAYKGGCVIRHKPLDEREVEK